MKIAFVTNMCPHYRVKTFETLANYHNVEYYFFSMGDEWYWQQQNGVQAGAFHHEYLPGVRLKNTRLTPTLPWKLLRGDYEAYIKCINGRFALPATYLIARLKRKPFILWTGVWMRLQTRAHRLFFPITRYMYRHADAIVVYGEHVKRYLVSEGIEEQRIFVTHHAVDNQAYNRVVSNQEQLALRQQLQIAPDQNVILYLGRLAEGKGLTYLLDAFASMNRTDTVFVLVGAGAEESRLKAKSEALGITRQMRFVGYVPTEETTLYYKMADIFVLPSITTATFKEPWGLVVNEAFNQGLPVIATDAVGAAAGGLVQNGVNGFVVPERDSQALANALEQLLDDEDLRHNMGQNALDTIRGWDNERMIEGFRAALDFVFGS